jgi:hypothetical protein
VGCFEHGNELLSSIKGGKFLSSHVVTLNFVNTNSASWS